MQALHAAAAATFAVTFALLALGQAGGRKLPRGGIALVGGLLTAVLLRLSWREVDGEILLLLAGLMVLAGLAEAAGLFAGLRRHLLRRSPGLALWLALALMVAVSAILLNDAAVLVLVPFLVPVASRLGLPPVPVVALLAVAANLGGLLTPFGNPQNVVLAHAAHLGLLDFLRVQGPLVLLGLAVLAIPCWWLGRHAGAPTGELPAPAHAHGRPFLVAAVLLFLAAAVADPWLPWGLGVSAAACAAIALAGLSVKLGREAARSAWKGLDWNVLAMFVGLFLLTGGLRAWFPSAWVPTRHLGSAATAGLATTALSNLIGNVPATLVLLRLDPAWTVAHAAFLVTVTTLGGSLLLTGSAASLIAAEQARRAGVELRFLPFLVHAAWILPVLAVGAWWTW